MNYYKAKRKITDKIFKTERPVGIFIKKIINTEDQQLTRLTYRRHCDINNYVIEFKYNNGKFYALLGSSADLIEDGKVDFICEYHDLSELLIDIENIESLFISKKIILKSDIFLICGAKLISIDSYDNRQFLKYQLSCLSPISFIKSLFDK